MRGQAEGRQRTAEDPMVSQEALAVSEVEDLEGAEEEDLVAASWAQVEEPSPENDHHPVESVVESELLGKDQSTSLNGASLPRRDSFLMLTRRSQCTM